LRVEKINNTQIKVVLNSKDMDERNIKFTEIALGTAGAHGLFRDVLEIATRDFGFAVNNVPLVIEAVSAKRNEAAFIVSRASNNDYAGADFKSPPAFRKRLYVKKRIDKQPELPEGDDKTLQIYSFNNLDEVSKLCKLIDNYYNGASTLHKDSGLYYLMVYADSVDNMTDEHFEALLSEFGSKHISNAVSKAYLNEHAEVIVAKNAVGIMSEL
jgi:adapter protein MecA 1/2